MKGDFDAFGFNGCRIPASFISPMNYKKAETPLQRKENGLIVKKCSPIICFAGLSFLKLF